MADFSQGLLSGFQFVDNLRARRQSQQLQQERINLARDADARAQQQLEIQQEQTQYNRERQGQIDEANRMAARIQEVGIGGLTDRERTRANELSAFNPNIGAAFEEDRNQRHDVEAIRGLAGVAQRGVSPATQSPGNQVTQGQPPEGFQTPFQVAAPDGQGLPAAQGQGTVTRHRTFVENMLGVKLPDELATPDNTVELPRDFYDRMVAAKDLPVIEQQKELDKLREEATGLSQATAFAKQQEAVANSDVNAWAASLNTDDRGGDALRQLASSSPAALTTKLHEEWNTIAEKRPDITTSLAREMYPAVEQTLKDASAAMSALPVGEDGFVDMRSPEAQNIQRHFNDALELQEKMSGSYSGDFQARIRANSMPIGNKELSAELAGKLADTPGPGYPGDANQRQMNMTMAQRAYQAISSGSARNLSTKQVESLAWLAKRKYISVAGFQQFLETGTFSDPKDAEILALDPTKMHYRVAPDGSTEIIWMPPKLSGVHTAEDQFGDQLKYLGSNVFVDPTGSEQGDAYQKRLQNEFLVTLYNHPEALGVAGLDHNDIATLNPQMVALLGERFRALKATESAYEDSWWAWLPGTANKLSELQVDFSNFDEYQRKYAPDTFNPQLPQANNDVARARVQLATSDDAFQRYLAIILSDKELDTAISEEQAAQLQQ